MNRKKRRQVIEPETVTERVAIVVMDLMNGEEYTTAEVAELAGLSKAGAWLLMSRLCRVIPITQVDHKWQMLREINSN